MLRRFVTALALGGVLAMTVAPDVGAETIADKQRKARQLAAKLETLETKAEQLVELYNDSRQQLGVLDEEVAQAEVAVGDKQTQLAAVRQRMSGWAMSAYVNASGSDPVFDVLGNAAMSDSVGIDGYTRIAAGKDAELSDELRQTTEDAVTSQARLANARAVQADLRTTLAERQSQAERAVAESSAMLADTNAELRDLIEAERIREEKAEQARVKAEIDARRAARDSERARRQAEAQAPPPGNNAPSPAATAPVRVVNPPPPPSPGAAGAVQQALSQVGTQYHWGQDDPDAGFDCSGLTSWAWGRVGVSLPRSSRAQFSALARVEPEDLEPGDLVFFGNPVHHVGMYIGNGEMVHSPQSGDFVKIGSVYRRDLRGGGRP